MGVKSALGSFANSNMGQEQTWPLNDIEFSTECAYSNPRFDTICWGKEKN